MTTKRKIPQNICCAKNLNGKGLLHVGSFVFLLLLLTASSCDKEPVPSGPSNEELARCAHVIDNGFLHQVCLNNSWPDELPPATQEGLSTFGCWINDTLAFVANDPREPARKEAYLTHYRSTWGGGVLIGRRDTYNEIDPLSISLNIAFDFADPSLKLLTSGTRYRINSSNQYVCDSLKSSANIEFDETSGIAYGTFNLTFYKPSTTDTLRLTDGRFDVIVSTF